MAEGEDAAEKAPEGEGAKKPIAQSKSVKLLLGVAVIVALLAVTAVVAYYVSQSIKTEEVEAEQPIEVGAQEKIQDPPFAMSMGTFISILMDDNGQSYNMKVKVSLIINRGRPDEKEVTQEILDRKIQLTDALNEVLVGTDPKDFQGNSSKRREGVNNLRESITRSVNSRMKHKIDGVFFEEFIFQ